jgi:hypothetical protein
MTSKRDFAISRRDAPEVCIYFPPPNEGVGNAGCRCTRSPLCNVESTGVEATGPPESPGIPARNGFNGLCRALPGDRALLPPSFADKVLSLPGWANETPQNLTPASGRQDHTILPSAKSVSRQRAIDRSQVFRLALRSPRAQNAAASTASHPAFVTIMTRPSVGWDTKSSRGDLGGTKTEIFLQKGLDSPVSKAPDGQITWRQREHVPLASRTRCSALRAAPQSRGPISTAAKWSGISSAYR